MSTSIPLHAIDIIRHKRDGRELSGAELSAFVDAAAHGRWPDYQLSALLMAIFLRGLTSTETATLTRAMADSGQVLDLSDLPGVKIDKHCTGGVGDKTSLILAPLAAACGVTVPMMSGRGLGHTGGTLDKLEAIPGFRVDLSEAEFRAALENVGVGMIGQTAAVAPADKKLYALRDVTSTVESIPLITASILSKKLAEGISGLVMDVKCGCGAFMKTLPEAKSLAESIVRVGTANGLTVEAVITRMEVPLGRAVGNALEVIECIETLRGNGPKDLEDLSVLLAARMVRLAGKASTLVDAEAQVRAALASGAGLDKFRAIVAQQGGDPAIVDDTSRLPQARHELRFLAPSAGVVTRLDAERVGRAAMALGAGRRTAEDRVDPAAGIRVAARAGERVAAGEPIFLAYTNDASGWPAAQALLDAAVLVDSSSAPPFTLPPLVLEVIS